MDAGACPQQRRWQRGDGRNNRDVHAPEAATLGSIGIAMVEENVCFTFVH
jgi:hypothetical protein